MRSRLKQKWGGEGRRGEYWWGEREREEACEEGRDGGLLMWSWGAEMGEKWWWKGVGKF